MSMTMGAPDSELMTYAVRMVIPIKREFGRSLDVHQLLHDLPYAREVIELALQSKDKRLNGYGAYMESKLLGPRGASPLRGNPEETPEQAAPPDAGGDSTKNAAMEKYKTRLR